MMQLELSRYIEGDLDDIADYIAQDNPVVPLPSSRKYAANFSTSAVTR
jgi:plasmid stabilization system protein ParE